MDEANEQIRLAEQTLSGMSGASAAGNGSPAAAGVMPTKPALAQGVDADAKAEAAPKKNATRAQGDERAESVTKEEPSPCDRACRALQSMTTAVNAICRMTGSDDARCAQAKSTLEKNRESASVRTCGCPRL